MPILLTTWHGTHLLRPMGDTHEIVKRIPAPQEAGGIALWLAAIRRAEVLPQERTLAQEAGEDLVVLERRLGSLGRLDRSMDLPQVPLDPNKEGYPSALLHEALLVLAVEETHGALGGPDLLIVHEVRALDDVVRSMNLLAERLREWYAVHAPEVNARVKDHAELARLVVDTPDPLEAAQALGVEVSGLGVSAPEPDAQLVARFAAGYLELLDLRVRLEERLDKAVTEVAPALAKLLSPNVAARMIAQAGGLEKLAYLPAGTVQTLGAENALFRHLREGSDPPKHGILFQHDSVYQAPWWLRGRIARALSGMVALGARSDLFGGHPETGERLRVRFDARVKEVRERHPAPPKRGKRRGPGKGGARDRKEATQARSGGGRPGGRPQGKGGGGPGKQRKGARGKADERGRRMGGGG